MSYIISDCVCVSRLICLHLMSDYTAPLPSLHRVSGDVVAAVVLKAIAAAKTSTREKARELLLMVVEIEKYEIVQEELVKGFSQKNPKVVAACIGALTLALRWVEWFGYCVVCQYCHYVVISFHI